MRIVFFLALVLSWSLALSQKPPGQGPEPQVIVTVDAYVKSLNFDDGALGIMNPSGPPGSFVRSFVCEATVVDLPAGWTIDGYTWGPQWEPGMLIPTGVLTFPLNTTGTSANGVAWTAGFGNPACTAQLRDPYGTILLVSGGTWVAAIGGSLTLEAFGEELETWNHDEDDTEKPLHLQYFGHSPQNVVSGYQIPRKGKVNPTLTQPLFTGITLTIEGPVVVLSDGPGFEKTFGATSESGVGAIVPTAHFALTLTNGFGEGDDCDDQMPFPETYKFTAHKPKDVTTEFDAYVDWNGVDENGPYFGKKLTEWFVLRDHLGQLMPGVAIQERFDPSYDQASIPDPSRYWITGLDPAGRTTSLDLQGYRRWIEPYEYPDYPAPIVTHRQLLVAGTRDRTWYGATGQASPPGGVNLGYYIVQKWTNRIVRQKESGT